MFITDLTEFEKIIKEYYEQLWDNNFGNLNKIIKFLENHKLPKLTQEETENRNNSIY